MLEPENSYFQPMKRFVWVLALLFLEIPLLHAQCTAKDLFLQVDSAWTFQKLQMVPFRFKQMGRAQIDLIQGAKPLLSLKDALQYGKIKVAEFYSNHDADIRVLTVKNLSKQAILINQGDLLAGGKQDRMVAETKILAPGTEEFLNVFCVEPGRWDSKPKPFKFGGSADLSLRNTMLATGRQSEIWKALEKQFGIGHGLPEGFNYIDHQQVLSDSAKIYLAYFKERLRYSDSSFAGFLSITGNKIIGCQLFSDQNFTLLSIDNIFQTAIAQALQQGAVPVMKKSAMEMTLKPLIESEPSQKHFLEKHGKAFYYRNRIVHLTVYDW
jgi:hypothetical protein